MDGAQSITFSAISGERLDKQIVSHIGDQLSRAQIQTLIRAGQVTVDGKPSKAAQKLKGGEEICVYIPPPATDARIVPEDIPLHIIYEDEALAVIDKAAGMVVHPGVGGEKGTLVAAALARWPQIAVMGGEEKRVGIVHRLDKYTSGLIIIAKEDIVRRRLMSQFQKRAVEKVYLALTETRPKTSAGRIELPIGRDPRHRQRMAVQVGGRPAISEFTVLDDSFPRGQALLRVQIHTGRTHQIRVHLAHIGCPIVGDTVYGYRKARYPLDRYALHASELAFDHPFSGERLRFQSKLPDDLQQFLAYIKSL